MFSIKVISSRHLSIWKAKEPSVATTKRAFLFEYSKNSTDFFLFSSLI